MKNQKGKFQKPYIVVMMGFLSLGYSWCLLSSGFACPPPPNDPPPPPPCTAACCTNDGGPSGNEGNNDSPIQKFGGVSGGLSADNLGPVVKFNTRESGGGGRNDKPGMSVKGGDGSGGPGGGAGGGGTSCPSCTSASGLDPVFMSTGEFQYALTDVYIPGPIPVEITRNYGNKRNNSTSFYGYNWTTNYDMRIREISSSVLSLTNAKGCASEYTLVSSNPNTYAYNGDASKYIIETSNPNGYDVIYKETGLTYHFLKEPSLLELNGRLKYIKDKYSNQITFDLSSSTGKITGITDCFGRYITFTYSTTAPYNLSQIQDFSGRQWQYTYTSGNLSRVRFPATPDCTSGLEYEYTYDDNHNLTDVHVDFNGYILCVVKNYYNTSNKVYQQIRYMGEIWEPRNNTSTVYYNTQAKTATIYDGEHHKKTITYNNAGMKSEETVYTDNTQENPNHFTTQYIYDSLNRLSRIIHPAGNCEEYTYNSEGFLEGIYKKTSASVPNNPSSPDVIATLYTYCSSSNPALYSKVETITDALGNVTEYEYFTDTGYLKKVTGPEITTPSGPRQASVEYTYTAAGMVDTITDPNGIVTKYVYYQTLDYNNGLLWKVIQDYGVGQQYLNLTTTYTYDELRRVLTVTNPKNAVTTYAYNAFNQVTQITSPSPFNYVTKYSYHFSGKPRKIERQTSDPANPWQVTEMTYNSLGQILTVKNALNKTTTYTYDQTERRSSVKDALNRETKYEYDERGLLVKVTDPNDDDTLYAYDLNGNRTSVTDSNGNTTSYEYDSFDRITKITNAEGHYRSITYDKLGRKITEIAYDRKDINNLTDDIALMQTRYEYNAAGDLIRRAIMADASAADTTAIDTSIDNVVDYTFYWGNGPRAQEKKYYANGSNAITYKFYDRLNRLRLQVDPSLNSTQYVYDSTDSVLRIQKVDKNPISGGADLVQTTDFIYDELGRRIYQIEKPQNPDAQSDSSWQVTQYVYDALNNRIQEIRPNGVIVLYGYDLLGRKISMVVDPIDANNPNGINQITEYGYDDVDRQITIAGYADNTNPATKQTTGYEYDNEDRVVQITYPDNAAIQYAYTSIGNVWRRTDQRGIQTYYTYDDTYNMTQKTATIGSVTTTENFAYDGLGRMLTAQKLEGVDQVSLSEFEYNDNGEISDAWESIFNLQEKQIQYAYDNAGYLVQTIYPNTVQIDRTNDWQGRIDTLTKGTTTFIDYAYMGNRVAERRSGSYIYFRPEYDNLGRMTRAYTYRDITNITLADFSYTFAANENNIETMSIDHRPNQPYNAFSYDNLDRITDVVYLSNQNDVESFPMDDLGNRTGSVTQRDGVHNYSVNTLTNRYTTIDSVSISYDAAGNLIQDKDGYHYVYDYENRVIRIFKLDGQTEVTVAQYAYDALGRRIWKYNPLATQPNVYYYYNDQWQILCEYTGTDSCLQWFTYGNYIDEVLSRNTSTTAMLVIQYYIQDHLYNVVGLTSSGGTVVERYEYDVYGNPTISGRGADLAWYTADDVTLTASAYNNLFNFTGRQLDVLDGGALKYMHYRYRDYGLAMGRFMQQDMIDLLFLQFKTNKSQLVNELYSYMIQSENEFNGSDYIFTMNKTSVFDYGHAVQLYRNMRYYSGNIAQWHDLLGREQNLYEYVRSNSIGYIDSFGLARFPGSGLYDDVADCATDCQIYADKLPGTKISTAQQYGACLLCCTAVNEGTDYFIWKQPWNALKEIPIQLPGGLTKACSKEGVSKGCGVVVSTLDPGIEHTVVKIIIVCTLFLLMILKVCWRLKSIGE